MNTKNIKNEETTIKNGEYDRKDAHLSDHDRENEKVTNESSDRSKAKANALALGITAEVFDAIVKKNPGNLAHLAALSA